jgi:hypothetical protein
VVDNGPALEFFPLRLTRFTEAVRQYLH